MVQSHTSVEIILIPYCSFKKDSFWGTGQYMNGLLHCAFIYILLLKCKNIFNLGNKTVLYLKNTRIKCFVGV